MHEKVLITGATGLLGTDLVSGLKGQFRALGVNSSNFDIRDYDAVLDFFKRMQPEVVLHSAAMVEVDGCETDPETANAVNVTGTENVAKACKEIGSRLVYYSTDYVFDGTKGSPYSEEDQTNPINVYGKTKLMGERKALDILDNACVMRISWLYGAARENFVTRMLRESRERYRALLKDEKIEPLKIVSDQFSSPTWSLDIADQTVKVIENNVSGIIHAVSENYCSRFSLAEYIFEEISWDLPMEPVKASAFGFKAPRPLNTPLENKRLNGMNLSVMRDYREALREFLGVYHGDEEDKKK